LLILWLLFLGLLWAAVLVHMFRSRAEGHRADSIGDFRYRLGVIGRTGGHAFRRPAPLRAIAPPAVHALPGTPRPRVAHPVGAMTPLQRRRRDVLVGLLSAAGASFLLAVVSGVTMMWMLHVLADVLLFTYVALLLHFKHLAMERHAKVHYLPRSAAPQLAQLRRTANS
jgi:hypothetical protein